MKVLFITHYSALYGANKSLINLIEGFESIPAEFCVVMPKSGELSLELDKRNIRYVIQEFNWWTGTKTPLEKNPILKVKRFIRARKREYQMNKLNKVYFNELKLKLEGFNPNIVFSNSSVINFGFAFTRIFDLPHVWFLRENQRHYQFNWFYNKRFVRRSFNRSELVITVSNYLREYYRKEVGIRNIVTVYNGVINKKNLANLDLRKERKENRINSTITFGILGVLHPKKGQAEAIRAFSLINKDFPNTKLIIVGLGDQTNLKKLVAELSLDNNIEFWGHIEDPFEAFLNMDIYLMCSRMEGLGRVTIEAMASGLPVIGYKEGGTIDIINENETGLFYENGFKDLAKQMRKLIKNRELRIRMGQNARSVFAEKYTSEVYAENVYGLIKEITQN